MRLKVDLQCARRDKIKKILCEFPQIRDQVYDEKNNIVKIVVVCCFPEEIRDKLYCKGRKVITCIEIVEPTPPPPPKPKKKFSDTITTMPNTKDKSVQTGKPKEAETPKKEPEEKKEPKPEPVPVPTTHLGSAVLNDTKDIPGVRVTMGTEINYPKHAQHPLLLQAESPYSSGSVDCDACQENIDKGFTYHCPICDFDVCLLCAFLDRKFKHSCHEHPLMLQQRRASFLCDACLTKEEDMSYTCTTCPFWIHMSCASMPGTKHHQDNDHPLSLAYSLPLELRNFEYLCDICLHIVHPTYCIYYCGPCRYFVHLKCTTQRPPQVLEIEGDKVDVEYAANRHELFQLPTDDFDKIIRQFSERHGTEDTRQCSHLPCYVQNKDGTELHLPILADVLKNTEKEVEIICDCCIKPITSRFYKCSQCKNAFHLACAELPLHIKHPFHSEHPLNLCNLSEDPSLLVECDGCHYQSNGVFYECKICKFRL